MSYDPPFRRHEATGQQPTTYQPAGYQTAGYRVAGHQAPGRSPASHHAAGEQSGGSGAGEPARFPTQPGFREEPDFRNGTAYGAGSAYPADGYGGGAAYQAGGGYGEAEGAAAVSEEELDGVFDDPEAAGRDRLAVHWIWEALLLVAVGGLAFLLWQADPAALRGSSLALLLVYAAGFGLLGLSAGMTLRAGAPNLAIGPVAVAAGVYFAQEGGDGVAMPAVTSLVAAVMLGALVAVLVVGFHVPGWAASLAAAAGVLVWLQLQPIEIAIAGGFDPSGQSAFLFALIAAVAILGGLLGTIKSMRRAVGRFRPEGDPARRQGGLAALFTSGAIVLSMAFAAAAGVLLVAGIGEAIGPGQPVEGSSGVTWLTWTVVGFGVALAGGTSAFGRRGGVFGTVLALLALVLFHHFQAAQELEIALLATAAVTLVVGLIVTRMVETFGRPRPASADPDLAVPETAGAAGPSGQWETTAANPVRAAEPATGRHADATTAAMGAEGWPGSSADSWSSALPARPAPGNADPWDDDRWSRH